MQDAIKSDEKVYSQYQLAEMFNVNPATAAKGLSLLVEENFLYTRNGGRHVCLYRQKKEYAKNGLMKICSSLSLKLSAEAKRLQVHRGVS